MNKTQFNRKTKDILIVDDTADNLQILSRILSDRGYKVRSATGGKQALNACIQTQPDLILLDVKMPDMNGFEVCQRLKTSQGTKEIPIIFAIAPDETFDKVKAFSVGAVDYIAKPFLDCEVLARVENQLKIKTLQKQLSERNAQLRSAETALSLSEEKFAKVFYSTPNLIAINRRGDGCYLEVNDGFLDSLGYSRAETIESAPEQLKIIVNPEDWAKFDNDLRESGKTRPKNIEWRAKSGEVKTLLVSAENIEIGGEKCVIFIGKDITDLEENWRSQEIKWEFKSQQTEQRMRLLERAIAASSNGIVITDPQAPENPIIYVNPGFERMTGYCAKEVIGKNCRFLQGEDTAQPQIEELRLAIRERRECSVTLLNYRKDGSLFWNELSISPVLDASGKLTQFIGVQTDVTERKRVEEALGRSQSLLASVLNSSLDGVMAFKSVRNSLGKIVDFEWLLVNPAAAKIVARADGELLGKYLLEEMPGNRQEGLFDLYVRVVETGEPQQREFYYKHEGLQAWFQMVAVKLDDGFAVTFRDITERKLTEEAIKQQKELLETIFDRLPVMIVYYNKKGEILLINREVERGLGWSEAELKECDLLTSCYPDSNYRQKVLDFMLAATEEWQDLKTRTRSGRIIDTSWANIRLSDGNSISIGQDITARKRAERALRESEARLQKLADTILGVIYILVQSPEGSMHFEYISSGCREIHELEPEQILDNAALCFEQTHPDDLQRVYEANAISARTLEPFVEEWRIVTGSGKLKWVQAKSRVERRKNGDIVWYGALFDISDRHNSEREIAAAKATLERLLQRVLLLKQITEEIRSSLDVGQIFQTAATQIGRAFGANRCLIHTYIAQPVPQIPIVAEYLESSCNSIRELVIPVLDNFSAQRMMERDKAIAFSDVYANPLLKTVEPLFRQIGLKSLLGIRTSYQGEPNGAIGLHQCDSFRTWTEEEIELLEAVAAQVGIAIAQANLLEQEKRQREKLDRQNIQLQEEIRVRKLAEEALQKSQRFIQAIADANPNLVYLYDSIEKRTIYTNRELDRVLGYVPEDVQNMGTELMHDLLHPDDWAAYLQHLKKFDTVKDGEIVEFEYRMRHKDGQWRWLYSRDIVFARTGDGKPKQILGTATDITELKQTEVALQQAVRAADAASRAKSAFFASMSHELRTPLNAILGFAQVMLRDLFLSAEHREHLKIINRSGEHLLSLIDDVLEMSKIEAGQVALVENSFDLLEMLQSLEERLEFKANSRDLFLSIECANDVPRYIKSDENKLRKILINILDKEIKFTRKGELKLRVKKRSDFSDRPREENEKLTGFKLYFEIEDTGSGIPPFELDSLFEPFVQTETGRQSQEGTGLGLPISRRFVQMMGGDITVSSTVGQGTIFKFDIRVSQSQAAFVESKQPKRLAIALEPDGAEYRILVVEDRAESRQLLVKLLTSVGFEVRSAVNGREAIATWESWKPHLIWMDMQMPVMNGYEATKHIKATLEGQATTIIALTASAFEEERSLVLSAGCDDFVRKPFREEMLFEKMAQYLGVRYRYDSILPPTSEQSPPVLGEVTACELAAMPPLWLENLYHAALCADDEPIVGLIEQIPSSLAPLADALADSLHNFRFDQIMEWASRALQKINY